MSSKQKLQTRSRKRLCILNCHHQWYTYSSKATCSKPFHTVPPTEDLVSMLASGGHSYSNHHMESAHMGCIWKWQYNLLIKRDRSNRPETETGKNKQKMRGCDVPEGTHQACRKDVREDIEVRKASVLGCFSVALINPITKATQGRKGFVLTVYVPAHHGGKSEQEPKQKPWRNAAHWLTISLFLYSPDHLPAGATAQRKLGPSTSIFIQNSPSKMWPLANLMEDMFSTGFPSLRLC